MLVSKAIEKLAQTGLDSYDEMISAINRGKEQAFERSTDILYGSLWGIRKLAHRLEAERDKQTRRADANAKEMKRWFDSFHDMRMKNERLKAEVLVLEKIREAQHKALVKAESHAKTSSERKS